VSDDFFLAREIKASASGFNYSLGEKEK